MDTSLIEIAELLGELRELIQKRNDTVTWRGNQIISVRIDSNGDAEILMSDSLPKINLPVTRSETFKSVDGSDAYWERMNYNDVTFEKVRYEGDGYAELAF